jgi:thiamine-phosphate pyrophosphorylase
VTAVERLQYVTVSPVYPSASKPGYGPALGLSTLRNWCAACAVPVLALGGVDSPARAAACVRAGAAGVAVMGTVMRAADPAAVVRAMVEAVCANLRWH